MNKKSKIYVVVLIWGAALLQLLVNYSMKPDESDVRAVMSQGLSNVYEGSVKAYAFYSDEIFSNEAAEQLVINLASLLGISSDFSINVNSDDNRCVTSLVKLGEQAETTIKFISVSETDTGTSYENYIMVDIILSSSAADSAYDVKSKLVDIYSSLGMTPNTNVYICEQIRGKLSDDEMNELANSFLSDMDADEVVSSKFDDVYCIYGYSRGIDEFVYQNSDRVNVNIAFSYDETEDVTFIHKAVPFVDKSM